MSLHTSLPKSVRLAHHRAYPPCTWCCAACLPAQNDKSILRQELPNLRPECLRVLEVSTTLLKMCAASTHTLFDIASAMTRPFMESDEDASELEKICVQAKACMEVREGAMCSEGGRGACMHAWRWCGIMHGWGARR